MTTSSCLVQKHDLTGTALISKKFKCIYLLLFSSVLLVGGLMPTLPLQVNNASGLLVLESHLFFLSIGIFLKLISTFVSNKHTLC